MCYYCEGVYASILIVGMIVLALKILAVSKFRNNIVIIATIVSCLLIMSSCSLIAEEEEIAPYIFISTVFVFGCELYNLIKISIEKYHTTQSYKMKCYKKINLINEYREKGVITQEEYQETRKQIISKIHK